MTTTRKRARLFNAEQPEVETSSDDEDYEALPPRLDRTLREIKEEIKKQTLTVQDILSTPLRMNDRVRLFQEFEAYMGMEENTRDWLQRGRELWREFQTAKVAYERYTPVEHRAVSMQLVDTRPRDSTDLAYRINALETGQETKELLYSKYHSLMSLRSDDPEHPKLREWIEWALKLPHDRMQENQTGKEGLTRMLKEATRKLDEKLYGMEKVKEAILLYLSAKIRNPGMRNCHIALVGPPGVGKTVISRLIAEIINFPYEQISFGGITDPDFLRGHGYTYVGAEPGEIVKCLARMKCKNGVVFFDEYEKVSSSKAIQSYLLHITDPSQNSEYRDSFLSEIPIDLSRIWFMYSMNELPEDSALRNRLFPIFVPGYKHEEKIEIARNYVLPRAIKEAGMKPGSITMSAVVAGYLVKRVCREDEVGIRSIERAVHDIVNRVTFQVNHQDSRGSLGGIGVQFDTGGKITLPVRLTEDLVAEFVDDVIDTSGMFT